jgi:dsDNA-specific endonuclease/ATPase MutS2
VQALGGGSLELPALAAARDGRTPALTDGGEAERPGEPVRIPIADALDLHPFAPRDVAAVVADYLEAAHARGFAEIRLIHGRGRGVQRRLVQSVLARHPLVAGYRDAPPERGGWGATIVALAR